MDYRKGFWILVAVVVILAINDGWFAVHYLRYQRLFSGQGYRIALLPPLADAKIDDLGAHIRTEVDAKSYIDAIRVVFPTISYYDEARLARDEYAAVKEPGKRIPESVVVSVYNQHMQEWQAPDFTPVTVQELHTFREHYLSLEYPQSMQLPGHTTPPDCRPVEALLLLHRLELNGLDYDLRAFADTGHLPQLTPAEEVSHAKADRDQAARTRDAIDKYFANHKDWQAFANNTLNRLGLQ